MVLYDHQLVGRDIIYKDYLGYERPGKIGFVEPYEAPSDEPMVWCYIVDDDPEYNNKQFIFNAGTQVAQDIRTLYYADLRLNTEIALDE